MGLNREIDTAVKLGLEDFQQFILRKIERNEAYLEQLFWVNGMQLTVLNYLLECYQEENINAEDKKNDFMPFIDFIIDKTQDTQIGAPLHQVIAARKTLLAIHLLNRDKFILKGRDKNGRTLLSLVLAIQDHDLLKKILDKKTDIHEITQKKGISYQPLHEAIVANFDLGVTLLAQAGAQLDNPVGVLRDTPVLLACRSIAINALEKLLEFPLEKLCVEAEALPLSVEKGNGDNAIELLCKQLMHQNNDKDLIKGIAMLLCCGAEPPRKEELRQLLANKRKDLLIAIDRYLDLRPELVDSFVSRCHLSQSPLHRIFYAGHSWGNALRHLLGKPNEIAFSIERLLSRKYSRPSEGQKTDLSAKAATVLTGKEPPLLLYAEFVRRYEETYKSQRISNPWSTMRWMITGGDCTWNTVLQYSETHPASRTRLIINDMFNSELSQTISEDLVEVKRPVSALS